MLCMSDLDVPDLNQLFSQYESPPSPPPACHTQGGMSLFGPDWAASAHSCGPWLQVTRRRIICLRDYGPSLSVFAFPPRFFSPASLPISTRKNNVRGSVQGWSREMFGGVCGRRDCLRLVRHFRLISRMPFVIRKCKYVSHCERPSWKLTTSLPGSYHSRKSVTPSSEAHMTIPVVQKSVIFL